MQEKPETKKRHEFEFVIDDRHIYHYAADFRSPQAKAQFKSIFNWKKATISSKANWRICAPNIRVPIKMKKQNGSGHT